MAFLHILGDEFQMNLILLLLRYTILSHCFNRTDKPHDFAMGVQLYKCIMTVAARPIDMVETLRLCDECSLFVLIFPVGYVWPGSILVCAVSPTPMVIVLGVTMGVGVGKNSINTSGTRLGNV